MSTVDDLDIERLLLDDQSTADQLASMRETLDKLMGSIKELTQNSKAQVNFVSRVLEKETEVIEGIPKLIAESFVQGSTRSLSKNSEELEQLATALLSTECANLKAQIRELADVERKLDDLEKLSQDTSSSFEEGLQLAEYDSTCMQEMAQLLCVQSTEVVSTVKNLLGMVKTRDESVIQNPMLQAAQGDNSTSQTATAPRYVQLNREQFTNVEYHAQFNPIAAAQGNISSQSLERRASSCFQQEKRREKLLKQKEFSRPKLTTTSSCQSELHDFPNQEINLAHMIAAMAFPDVEAYADPKGANFETFVAKFKMK